MPSPLPGMDPYLEQETLWPAFQHQMVLSLYQYLLPVLVDRYRARVVQRSYVTEQALFTSILRETQTEPYLEIRQRSDNRLIVLVDVVSPINKRNNQGRIAYHATRRDAQNVHAAVVEIDLLLAGQPMLENTRDALADCDYAVTVIRSPNSNRHEITTASLQKRLPRFRIPLASDDRDTVIDLQTVFVRSYEQGDFAGKIDYRCDPTAPLSDQHRLWLDETLRQQKVRS